MAGNPRLAAAALCAALCAAACSRKPEPLDKWLAIHGDFSQLSRYRKANAGLKPPAPGEKRVIFMGDSITDNWPLAGYFPGKPYIGRGIGGQVTAQMLARFHQDVVALKPAAVVILGGTNDIVGGYIPATDVEGSYISMADIARANGIRVIFASVLPVNNYDPKNRAMTLFCPLNKLRGLNTWLEQYCKTRGFVYLDFFNALKDNNGLLKAEYSNDGVHPNAAGYAAMAPLTQAAIDRALE
ncbi:MAG: SGNH/GDSL hydrolase family protein [Elusimicrobiales bacterium]